MFTTLRVDSDTCAADRRPRQPSEPRNFGSLIGSLLSSNQGSSSANAAATKKNNGILTIPPTRAILKRKQLSSRPFGRDVRKTVPMLDTPSLTDTSSQTDGDLMDASSLMGWLQKDCPQDLVPRVLAYAGPQTTAALSKTCRFWKEMTDKESTWRILCEELYKWKEGDEEPESWRDFYKFSPCVPVDFSTVDGAFAVVRSSCVEQTRSIRVLLRPGRYVLREAITVEAPQSAQVEVETMEVPDSYLPIDQTSTAVLESEPAGKRSPLQSLRNILACRTVDVEETEEDAFGILEFFEPSILRSNGSKRASLFLHTRRKNEPIIRVRQGTAVLRNVDLKHFSLGLDVFNGNAAVHIQPQNSLNDTSATIAPGPILIMEGVDVTSASGRGVVDINGGQATIRNCHVHDCASTGIYVGGPGSRAQVERTDVVRNGKGNTTPRRGLAKGHSGLYLEQGHLSILDCNISQNSASGISVLSPDSAVLSLEESEIVSNGSKQLDLPPLGSASYSNSNTVKNIIAPVGAPRSRSTIAPRDLSL